MERFVSLMRDLYYYIVIYTTVTIHGAKIPASSADE